MQDYNDFVDKFKPKKTTDDCYTPPAVYDVVKDWAVKEYHLQGRPIVRPFYPGGDYEHYNYPDNCVVIDNPPFSILASIKDFYKARGIHFFLFAPHLTLFSRKDDGTNYVLTSCTICFANGAKVDISFATDLGTDFIRTAPDLRAAIAKAQINSSPLPKYRYPNNVISAALLSKICHTSLRISRAECSHIRQLDSQKEKKKNIFGGGFLISDTCAAKLNAAKLNAAKLRTDITEWTLSDREKNIIKNLGS